MHCWPRYLLWSLIIILAVGNMLAACTQGQKGDLYLPEQAEQEQQDPSEQ
jgi:predicted small lipoprotein YifL